MIFPDCRAPLRTDADFRNNKYPEHQKVPTILRELPIDLIEDFPIGDALHIIDLGWTKRFLNGCKHGSLSNYGIKWSMREQNEVSEFLKNCRMPYEIQRTVRGLEELAHWKGTEYRTFLLYISLVVFKKFIGSQKLNDHFLLYFCAIHICSRNDQTQNNLKVARAMLLDYLDGCKKFNGIQYFTSNLHNLCHLVDDVEKFGPLETFLAYPFESRLYYVKRLLRTGANPLPQVARRITEVQNANCFQPATSKIKNIGAKCPLKNVDIEDESLATFLFNENARLYTRIQLPKFELNCLQDNNKWIFTSQGEIVSVKYCIKSINNKYYLYGIPIIDATDFFKKPVRSSKLNIYQTECKLGLPKFYLLDNIHSKLAKIDVDHNTLVFVPLIHTIKP